MLEAPLSKTAWKLTVATLLLTAGLPLAAGDPDLPECPQVDLSQVAAPGAPPAPGEAAACKATGVFVESPRLGAGPTGGIGILSTGYHHRGVHTSATNVGVTGVLGLVNAQTDVTVQNDFVANRLMRTHCSGASAQEWLEVGWMETAFTGGIPQVYTYDPDAGGYTFYSQYNIDPGVLSWTQFWLGHTGNNVWKAYFYTGVWNELISADLGSTVTSSGCTEAFVEVHTTGSGYYGNHVYFPTIWQGQNQNVGLQLYTNQWKNWDTSFATTEQGDDGSGYTVSYTTKYKDWRVAAPKTVPGQANNIQAFAGGLNTVFVDWDAAPNGGETPWYEVYRNGGFIGSTAAGSTSFDDTNAPATDQALTYRVKAVNSKGAGAMSQDSACTHPFPYSLFIRC